MGKPTRAQRRKGLLQWAKEKEGLTGADATSWVDRILVVEAAGRKEQLRKAKGPKTPDGRPLPYTSAHSVSEVRQNNEACHRNFFSPDTLRFFKSKVGDQLYTGPGGKFFTTSEKGPDGVRRYSVREAVKEGCEIKTVEGFQRQSSSTAAKTVAKRLAAGKK